MTDKHTQPLEPTVTAGESDLVCFGTTATYALAPIMPDIADLIGRNRNACVGRPATVQWPHRLFHDNIAALAELQAEVALNKTTMRHQHEQNSQHIRELDAADAENELLKAGLLHIKIFDAGDPYTDAKAGLDHARAIADVTLDEAAALKETTT